MTLDPIEEWRISSKTSNNAQRSTEVRGQPTRRATARVLPGAPRPATEYLCRHRPRDYRLGDISGGWRSPEVPCRHLRPGIERSNFRTKSVPCSVLVRFGRQRGRKTWVWGGLATFWGAAGGGVLCTRGRQTSRCGCSGSDGFRL